MQLTPIYPEKSPSLLTWGMIRKLLFFCLLGGGSLMAQTQIWGSSEVFEQGVDLQAAASGGSWLMGIAELDSFGKTDISLQRLGADGSPLYQLVIGSELYDYPARMYFTPRGTLLLSGLAADSSAFPTFGWVREIDTLGNPLHTWWLGDTVHNLLLKGALPTPDGGALAWGAESAANGVGNDSYVVRLNANGTPRWRCNWQDSLSDYAQAVVALPDGGFAIVGDHQTTAGPYNAHVVRIDSLGQVLWTARENSPLNGGSQDLMLLPDGDLLVIGESEPAVGQFAFDFYAARVSPSGVWGREFFEGSTGGDAAFRGALGPDGQLIFTGYGWNEAASSSDLMVVITDTAFSTGTTRLYGGPSVDHGFSILTDSTGYRIAGFTSQGMDSQYLLVTDTWQGVTGIPAVNFAERITIFPNPIRPGDTLQIPLDELFQVQLLDLSGRRLGSWDQNWLQWQVPATLATGRYLLKIQAGIHTQVFSLELSN